MRRFLASALGLLLGANALWMLAAPLHWYAQIPGAAEIGPANSHFIRDIGCAYLMAALALFWFAAAPRRAWPALLAGGTFLFLHALIHVWDTLAGREHSHRLLTEIPTVILPAFIVLWLGWDSKSVSEKEP
jgi:hypothetical protein